MSYILDAIRKSDQQRSRGAAPTLLTAQAAPPESALARRWSYPVVAIVLLGVGIGIGMLSRWLQQEPAPSQEAAVARNSIERAAVPDAMRPPVPAPVVPPPLVAPPPPPAAHAPQGRPAPAAAANAGPPMPAEPVRAVTALPMTPPNTMAPPNTPAANAPAANAPAAAGKVTAELPKAAEPAREQRLLTFAELPLQVQQEFPRMAISVHAYSSQPKNRLVGIDSRMLHEGDSPSPGLKVEEITPDGMIFSYRGYRFSRSVQDFLNNR